VHEKDVIEASNRESLRRDLTGGLSSHVSALGRGRTVDLGGGYSLREITASSQMVGHSLRELGLRERTGVQVLLVRPAKSRPGDASAVRVPAAEDQLKEGDTLVIASSAEGLSRLENL
jgi:Trk K+ transport system NAD-binding subunit